MDEVSEGLADYLHGCCGLGPSLCGSLCDCGDDPWVCEGCWEGVGFAECSEHPFVPEPEPLRVKIAEVM